MCVKTRNDIHFFTYNIVCKFNNFRRFIWKCSLRFVIWDFID